MVVAAVSLHEKVGGAVPTPGSRVNVQPPLPPTDIVAPATVAPAGVDISDEPVS